MRLSLLLRAALSAIAAAGLLAGCGDDDNPMKAGPGPTYQTPSSPADVLQNLVAAYAYRDTVEYPRIFDLAYAGTSMDMRFGTNSSFTHADEVRHIQTLRKAGSVIDIQFDLGPASGWQRLPSDDPGHPEWALIQIAGSNFRLRIDDTSRGMLTVNNWNGTHFFRFKPTTPAASSPTDTTWTLVEWEEFVP